MRLPLALPVAVFGAVASSRCLSLPFMEETGAPQKLTCLIACCPAVALLLSYCCCVAVVADVAFVTFLLLHLLLLPLSLSLLLLLTPSQLLLLPQWTQLLRLPIAINASLSLQQTTHLYPSIHLSVHPSIHYQQRLPPKLNNNNNNNNSNDDNRSNSNNNH